MPQARAPRLAPRRSVLHRRLLAGQTVQTLHGAALSSPSLAATTSPALPPAPPRNPATSANHGGVSHGATSGGPRGDATIARAVASCAAATSDAATSDAATSDAATSDAATSHAATSHAATSHAATSHAATSDGAAATRGDANSEQRGMGEAGGQAGRAAGKEAGVGRRLGLHRKFSSRLPRRKGATAAHATPPSPASPAAPATPTAPTAPATPATPATPTAPAAPAAPAAPVAPAAPAAPAAPVAPAAPATSPTRPRARPLSSARAMGDAPRRDANIGDDVADASGVGAVADGQSEGQSKGLVKTKGQAAAALCVEGSTTSSGPVECSGLVGAIAAGSHGSYGSYGSHGMAAEAEETMEAQPNATPGPRGDGRGVEGEAGGGEEGEAGQIAVSLGLQLRLQLQPGEASAGLELNRDEHGTLVVRGLAPGSSAARCGLEQGDRIVSVGGVPLSPSREVGGGVEGGVGGEVDDPDGDLALIRAALSSAGKAARLGIARRVVAPPGTELARAADAHAQDGGAASTVLSAGQSVVMSSSIDPPAVSPGSELFDRPHSGEVGTEEVHHTIGARQLATSGLAHRPALATPTPASATAASRAASPPVPPPCDAWHLPSKGGAMPWHAHGYAPPHSRAAAAGGVGAAVPYGLALHSLAAMPAVGGAGGAGASALVFAAGRDGGLHGYGASGERQVSLGGAHSDRIWSLAAIPASTSHPALIASASADCSVRLWCLAPPRGGGAPRLEQWTQLLGHSAPVHAVMARGDGVLLASGSEDCTVRLWDIHSHELRGVCAPPPHATSEERTAVYSLAPTRSRVWCGRWGGGLGAWDPATCTLVRSVRGAHEGAVWALQALAEQGGGGGIGGSMASAGDDGAVRVWDERQARAVAELPEAGCALYALASHPDGALVLAGYDGVLRMWEPRAARLRLGTPAHSSPVRCLLMHGGMLWSGATDGTLATWSLGSFFD
jgi:hypothetical protein